jgi:hypothetical protein
MALFKVFYFYQGFLPWWITGAVLWWFGQLAYRRRYGLIGGSQLYRSLGWFSLAVLSSPWLGPLAFYGFLFYWLFRQPGREHPVLHRWNLALATLLVGSALGHTWLDWQRPVERSLSRILDSSGLDEYMRAHPVDCAALAEWAAAGKGRLRSNAVYLLRYCPSPEAERVLREVERQGPPLDGLARASLAARR